MASQHPKRKSKTNRPTDSFGGPSMRGNNISLVLVLAALAFFAVLQWTAREGALDVIPATATVASTGTESATETAVPAVMEAAADSDATSAATTDGGHAVDSATPPNAGASSGEARGAQIPTATEQPTPTANAPPTTTPRAARASDLPTIDYDDLPPEAHETIMLIDAGGPFPFSRDGVTFQNRERLLPRHPEGYYREYTVITPGSRDRGARRIVTGEAGEMYYTADHYASFREIVR